MVCLSRRDRCKGRLGNGTWDDSSLPVDVTGLAGATQISAGGSWEDGHSCAVVTGGAAKCWGQGIAGQLGQGTKVGSNVPEDVVSLTAASSISAGGAHTCAVVSGGAAKCWGKNRWEELGDGTTYWSAVPVDVIAAP